METEDPSREKEYLVYNGNGKLTPGTRPTLPTWDNIAIFSRYSRELRTTAPADNMWYCVLAGTKAEQKFGQGKHYLLVEGVLHGGQPGLDYTLDLPGSQEIPGW